MTRTVTASAPTAYGRRFRLVPTDLGRLVCAVSIPWAWMLGGAVSAVLMLLVFGGLWALRYYARRTSEDAVGQLVLLASGWLSVVGVYRQFSWLDVLLHAVATMVLTRLVFDILAHHGMLSVPGRTERRLRTGIWLGAAGTGTLLGVLWEFGEWAGHEFLSEDIGVGYADTIGDLSADLAGALLGAALALEAWTTTTRGAR